MKKGSILSILIVLSISCISKGKIDVRIRVVENTNRLFKSWLNNWDMENLQKESLKLVAEKNIEFKNDAYSSQGDAFKFYSTTKKSFIDIFSGTYELDSVKRKIKNLVEPESILIYGSKSSAYQLLHYGYSVVFEDAAWITESEFLIVGYEIKDENNYKPMIWYFNLRSKKNFLYDFSPDLKKPKANYLRYRWPQFDK